MAGSRIDIEVARQVVSRRTPLISASWLSATVSSVTAPLVQTTLTSGSGAGTSASAGPSRKRAVPDDTENPTKPGWVKLADGSEVNLKGRKTLEPSKEFVDTLVSRVLELEGELEPVLKKQKLDAVGDAKAVKAEQKRVSAKLKSFFDRIKKDSKTDAHKFKGHGGITIKIEEVLPADEFERVFMGKGNLIQPTPKDKPNSKVTIIDFSGTHIDDLFAGVSGVDLKALKGNMWTQGGIHEGKARKIGAISISITSINVSYSAATNKATIVFEIRPDGQGGYGGYDSY